MVEDHFNARDSTESYRNCDAYLAHVWNEFNARFDSETACLEELYRRLSEQRKFKCRKCENDPFGQNSFGRAVQCRTCKRKCWKTAGTFFDRIRLARPWLAAIWLMERGAIINAFKFHRLVGIAYSSSLNIFRKLTVVIEEEICEDGLELPSGLFLEVVCRRSRETPIRGHPRDEQLEIETQAVATKSDHSELPNLEPILGGASSSRASSTKLSEGTYVASDLELHARNETLVLGLLSDRPLHFDVLYEQSELSVGELSSALTILELDGEIVRLPGEFYVRSLAGAPNQTLELHLQTANAKCTRVESVSTVRSAISFIRETFKGISRKYLQNYLTVYSCFLDRKRWCIGSIMTVCIESGPIRIDEIREYVTPRMVKVRSCV